VTDLAWTEEPGEGPAAVLLHEGAGSRSAWDRLRPALTSGRRTLTYDRRGFGRSPRTASFAADHFDQACDDLATLLRGRGTQRDAARRHDLVGHSDGGSVALLVAARHPELVRSVTVVATHVYADPATVTAVAAMGAPRGWDARVQRSYAAQHGDDWERVVADWLGLWTGGALARWDLRRELAAISCPVLVVHDRRDPLSPVVHAAALTQGLPDVRVAWHDTGSHRPHLADRDGFIDEVHAFWTSLGRADVGPAGGAAAGLV
jgi:pimeloyl-ACP methyl ester carboxylesterase